MTETTRSATHTVQDMTTKKADSLYSIEREVGVLLHRVRRSSIANASAIHPDLQPAAYSILLHVLDHEGACAADIVEHFGIDKGAVSRQVAHLEKLGLVERSNNPDDRRVQTLVGSSLARGRVETVRQERRSVFRGRLRTWTAEDLQEFAAQLGRYNASLEK